MDNAEDDAYHTLALQLEEPSVPSTQILLEKIQALPPERLGEVEDFVDFLNAKSRRLAALDRLLTVAPALEAAGAADFNEGDIQAEIDAVRARGARDGFADRS